MRHSFLHYLLLPVLACSLLQGQEASFAALEQRHGGRLGVLALDTGTGRTLGWRAGELFPMCSTFKLLLAAQCLWKVDHGQESLARILPYGPSDLLAYAPVTARHVGEKGLSVGTLCEAAVTVSDNTAANLLLAAQGGPAEFTRFLRSLGDAVTRLDRTEPALNEPVPGQDLDTTSPEAMVATLRKVLLGDVLAPTSRKRLQQWLLANTTGARRLKAGLPPGWRIGDKTGTGGQGATNDLGLLFPPGRTPILVTAYYCGSTAPMAEREAVLAAVGGLIASELGAP